MTLRCTIFLLTIAACATSQSRTEDRLRADLDAHRIQKPLVLVWPAALRIVAEHGYEFVGHDREVVGQPAVSSLRRVTRGGFSTRKANQGIVAETMENADRVHYRIEGTEYAGAACQVRFISIRRTGTSPSEERSRALDLELQLLHQLEPDEASRMERDGAGAAVP